MQHPEIKMTWRVPPAPTVRVRAGQKELCFPKGADAAVHLDRAAKRVRIFVEYEIGKEKTICADLRELPVGDGANPRREGPVRFLVQDQAGRPVRQTRIVQYATTAGNRRGLDAGFRTIIDVPGSDFVELELTRLDEAPRLEASGSGGVPITQVLMAAPPGNPSSSALSGHARSARSSG
jgi:hypothetical protein